MKNRLIAVTLILILALSCAVSDGQVIIAAGPDFTRLGFYKFNPASPLAKRIVKIPDSLLKYYSRMDGKRNYAAYSPSAPDKGLVLKYLALLPPVYQSVLSERCVGIYFVRNFMGNGLAGWVAGDAGRSYFYIVLNPDALKNSLSATLTQREKSCFIIPGSGRTIRVDAGRKFKGLAYALFHEATHGVDYVKGVTHFTAPELPKEYRTASPVAGRFFKQVWGAYAFPWRSEDHSLRKKITFYGLGGGPKIPIKSAPALYKWLLGSPFVSLYATKSWAEDFAELATFNMLTQELGQPYRIILTAPGAEPAVFEPMRSPKVLSRAEKIMGVLESF